MKQSIFILVALWGLIGSFGSNEKTNSQNARIQIQDAQAIEMIAATATEMQ